jgi:tetratricopeptide (TPR) repeat protein
MTSTNWTPSLIALGVSVLAVMLFFALRRKNLGAPLPVDADDAEAQYQRLLSELKELEANKHLMNDAQFAAQRQELEQRATAALKEKLTLSHEMAKASARAERKQEAPKTFLTKYPGLVGAVVGGAVVGFFAYLAHSLTQNEAPPQMEKAGPPAAGQAATAGDAKIEALLSKVRAAPGDVDALADVSIALMRRQAFQEARPFILRGSAIDPFHAKTRVGRAVLLALDGDMPGALKTLETLAAKYPDAFDGRMFAGMIALDQNDNARALQNFEAYLSAAPPQDVPPMLRAAVSDLRTQLIRP